MEIRVACSLAIVIAVFTACWFPLIVTMFATGEKLVRPKEPAHMWFRTSLAILCLGLRVFSKLSKIQQIFRHRITNHVDCWIKLTRGNAHMWTRMVTLSNSTMWSWIELIVQESSNFVIYREMCTVLG